MKINLKKLLPGIRKNVPLKNFSTFKMGGKARYFFVAKIKDDLIRAVNAVTILKLPFFILGNGSNLLISDKGFKGLIIKVQITRTKCQNDTIYAEAGFSLGQLVNIATKNNLTGLEWAVGIPGTLGGAIYGNAGAFGQSISDTVSEVKAFDIKGKKIKTLKNKECKFGYRESIFKKNKNLIIISAKVNLKKSDRKKITQKIKEYLIHRIKTQPLNFPSIGSIFKNPKGHFAAELIEKCGLKGKKVGDVKISEKHANFIINLGKGRARDVVKLINIIKKKVREKFRIGLEEEIIYFGF